MIRNISLIILGFVLGVMISFSYAKYESGSGDAQSVVLYGKTSGGTLVPIQVDATGIVATNPQ